MVMALGAVGADGNEGMNATKSDDSIGFYAMMSEG